MPLETSKLPFLFASIVLLNCCERGEQKVSPSLLVWVYDSDASTRSPLRMFQRTRNVSMKLPDVLRM